MTFKPNYRAYEVRWKELQIFVLFRALKVPRVLLDFLDPKVLKVRRVQAGEGKPW